MTELEVAIKMAKYAFLVNMATENLISRYGLESRISQALALLKEEFEEAFEDEDYTRTVAIAKIIAGFDNEQEEEEV